MKQKDIALIVVIIFISAIISLFASKAVFGSPKTKQQSVEVVQPITADFPKPDPRYFNDKAFDPTRVITIGENTNPNPFNTPSSSQ
jgi:hypothetical protein